MRIAAIDTGRTAGIARWYDGDFDAWEQPGWDAVRLVMGVHLDILIVEKLAIQQRAITTKGEVMEAIEQLGALRYWAAQQKDLEFELSPPSDAMNFATNDKLRRAGMYTPKEHGRDATRHLLLALVKRGLGPDPSTLIGD